MDAQPVRCGMLRVMVMRRLSGLGGDAASSPDSAGARAHEPSPRPRRCAASHASSAELEPDRRRFLAGFAYVLSRAAHADLDISADETRLMEHIVTEIGELPEAQAVLVVEIAKHQSRALRRDRGLPRDARIRRARQRRAAPRRGQGRRSPSSPPITRSRPSNTPS